MEKNLEDFCRRIEGSRATAEIAPIESGAENMTVSVDLTGAELTWPMLFANMIRRSTELRGTDPEDELMDIIIAMEELILDREIDIRKVEKGVRRYGRKKLLLRRMIRGREGNPQ